MNKLYIPTSNSIITLFCFLIIQVKLSAQALNYIPDSTGGIAAATYDGGPTEFDFTDINDDGFIDILSIGDHGSPGVNTNQHGVMVWFGDGTGTHWSLAQNGSFGYGGIAVGDVNNDGKKDIGYAMHHDYSTTDFGNQYQEVALGDGTGINWTPWDDSLGLNGETWGMNGTDFGDIDNDGLLDIGSISLGCCDGVHIHKNLGNGVWPQVFGFIGGNSLDKIHFGDINNDGNLDFVVTHQNGTCYFGDGHGNFTLNDSGLVAPGIQGYRDVALADVDNDGTLELGFINGNFLGIYKFSNTTHTWHGISTGLPTGIHLAMMLEDLNMDGFTDLLTFKADIMFVYRGDGGSTWVLETADSIKNLRTVNAVAVADVDHSGTPDILMHGTYPVSLVADKTTLKLFREATTAISMNVAAVYPKGYECFPNGGVRFIKWISSVPNGVHTKINLEYSTTGTSGPWTMIASNLPDNGSYQWIIPAIINSADCYIRYTIMDTVTQQSNSTVNPRPFNIGCTSTVNINVNDIVGFDVSIFPNPFHENTSIVISGNEIVSPIFELYDLQGRLLRQIKSSGDKSFTLEKNGLSPGIYFIRISTTDAHEIYRKIIIQ